MKTRTREEWLKWYAERTGCEDLELRPDELIMFHPEHGFITYSVHDASSHVRRRQILVWRNKKIAKFENVHTLRAYTRRNPQAWIRKYGGHITGYEMEVTIDEIKI